MPPPWVLCCEDVSAHRQGAVWSLSINRQLWSMSGPGGQFVLWFLQCGTVSWCVFRGCTMQFTMAPTHSRSRRISLSLAAVGWLFFLFRDPKCHVYSPLGILPATTRIIPGNIFCLLLRLWECLMIRWSLSVALQLLLHQNCWRLKKPILYAKVVNS